MSGHKPRRPRLLSDDERTLWKTVTQAIEPMRPAKDAAGKTEIAPPRVAVKSQVKPRPAQAPALKPPPAPPALAVLDRRLKQRVARGRTAIDDRLDLHGMTQTEAHAALKRFLRRASADGAKIALVITGKGRGEGERGVLRRQVPLWLKLPEFRDLVIGFEAAAIAHGGEGALYVQVRRPRL